MLFRISALLQSFNSLRSAGGVRSKVHPRIGPARAPAAHEEAPSVSRCDEVGRRRAGRLVRPGRRGAAGRGRCARAPLRHVGAMGDSRSAVVPGVRTRGLVPTMARSSEDRGARPPPPRPSKGWTTPRRWSRNRTKGVGDGDKPGIAVRRARTSRRGRSSVDTDVGGRFARPASLRRARGVRARRYGRRGPGAARPERTPRWRERDGVASRSPARHLCQKCRSLDHTDKGYAPCGSDFCSIGCELTPFAVGGAPEVGREVVPW